MDFSHTPSIVERIYMKAFLLDGIQWPDFDFKTISIILGILFGAAILTRVVRVLISKSFVSASEKLNVDPTRYKFFKNAASLIIWVTAISGVISLIPALKTLAITLFAGAGIMVAIIGFAAQEAFSNIISGVFIIMFKPFRVGDLIQVTGFDPGLVDDITLRHTVLLTFENKRLIIPNSTMGSESILNSSIGEAKVCRYVEVGISYDSDIDLAMEIIQEVAQNHPDCLDERTPEEKASGMDIVNVRVIGFGDSSINLRAYVWTADPLTAMQMHSDINRGIKEQFDLRGVEIPFPYRTLVYKSDLEPNAKKSAK